LLRIFLITGPPASGKTSLLREIIAFLEKHGKKISGILCEEFREGNIRKGFRLFDIRSKRFGILASVDIRSPFRVSKYGVNIKDLNDIGVSALRRALIDDSDVVVIDEIGKMELISQAFVSVVRDLVESKKTIIGIIPIKIVHPIIKEIRERSDTKVFYIDRYTVQTDRERIFKFIVDSILRD